MIGESYDKLSVNYVTRNGDSYNFLKSFGRTREHFSKNIQNNVSYDLAKNL